ncbi:hypothetical protein CRUP_019944, partial [Coryphaenoides rupestris]
LVSEELEELLVDNERAVLKNIAEELRSCLPRRPCCPRRDAPSRSVRCCVKFNNFNFVSLCPGRLQMQQQPKPAVHVDAFLYGEEEVDSLCEEGRMSRSYCRTCGSHLTAPLEFVSHSFSISELRFLFQNVLPDLAGRTLLDVGSRLGAVLYGGYVYSAASRLVGVEISEEFVRLQTGVMEKYGFTDRMQGEGPNTSQWVEEIPIDYDVNLGTDMDPDALRQIHLYRVTSTAPSR